VLTNCGIQHIRTICVTLQTESHLARANIHSFGSPTGLSRGGYRESNYSSQFP
jgi:hypothetical protein